MDWKDSQCCITISTVSWQNMSITPARKPVPPSSHFHFRSPFIPWQAPTYFLSLWFAYPGCFTYVNGLIQHVVICVWLLSLSTKFSKFPSVVACINTSFLLMAKWYSNVWTEHFISFNSGTLGYFHFWGIIIMLWTFVYTFLLNTGFLCSWVSP